MDILQTAKSRFSNRVDEYAKYRPTYPIEVIENLKQNYGLKPENKIADVGSGTGISSKLFLDFGCEVFGVEPNLEMRERSAEELVTYKRFQAIDGSASETSLPNQSVDFVVVAQALHWFDLQACKAEFKRILKPNGKTIILYNQRPDQDTGLSKEYQKLLEKYGRDYQKLRHRKHSELVQDRFFVKFDTHTFSNHQTLDFDGLVGRAESSSYMPKRTDPEFPKMKQELKQIFEQHNQQGLIQIHYQTCMYVGDF